MKKFINKLSEVDSGCVAEVGFKSAGIGELQSYDRKGSDGENNIYFGCTPCRVRTYSNPKYLPVKTVLDK